MTTYEEVQFQCFCETLTQLFDAEEIQALARETNFSIRKSKFGGHELLACAFFSQSLASESLLVIAAHLGQYLHLSITPQALHERFDATAVQFLEAFFHQLLREEIMTSDCPFLNDHTFFKRIRIADATTFYLDPRFRATFPGSGGVCHTAGVKIQLEYDLTTGRMLEVFLGAEKDSDHLLYARTTAEILPGDLVIRDMGYFKLEEYQAIQAAGGFYVTRAKINTLFTVKNPTPEYSVRTGKIKPKSAYLRFDLQQLADTLQPGEIREYSDVYCGKHHLLGTRMIVYALKPEEQATREKQIKRVANRRKPLAEETHHLKKLNVYLTNCPVENVSTHQVHELYSLRWQIEILFKIWKSTCAINQVKPINIQRIKCHIYSKLIAIWLLSTTMFRMRALLYEKAQKELSEQKAMSVLLTYLPRIFLELRAEQLALMQLFSEIFRFLERNGKKSRRKEKSTSLEILVEIALNQQLEK